MQKKSAPAVLWLLLLGFVSLAHAQNPSGDLLIEPVVAYNMVVDSNIENSSGYSPSAAYIGVKFCNIGTDTLYNVTAYTGNYASNTPGIFPVMWTNKPGPGLFPFSLTFEGGTPSAFSPCPEAPANSDATRFLGPLYPGECRTIYWLVSYPLQDSAGNSVFKPGNADPTDDLHLFYDIWGTAESGGSIVTAGVQGQFTMRNEISASASRIFPNTANKVPQEYLDLLQQYQPAWTNTPVDGTTGTRIYTEGYWYDLGVVGRGFDNDGDMVPDSNVWMQPVGDASRFNASCFRLVKTRAMIVVKLIPDGEQVYIVEDQLYFENLPENRGVIGLVQYEFMPLTSDCYSQLTPYQEVAAGINSEKFNSDYGVGMSLWSGTSTVEIAKGASTPTVIPGSNISYTVSFTNWGNHTVGSLEIGSPIVIHDRIPSGTHYIAGSATNYSVLPTNVPYYLVRFSTNNGVHWTESEPVNPTHITDIQWWLSGGLESNAGGQVGFDVQVDADYNSSDPFICNWACISYGSQNPFGCDKVRTELLGDNSLGDTVWADDGSGGGFLGSQVQESGEPGISNITVRLYSDANTNHTWDPADPFVGSTVTRADGYYMFTNLLDGMYIAVADWRDPDLPYGYTETTPMYRWADLDYARTNSLAVIYTNADFGFAPALVLDKRLIGSSNVYEGRLVTFNLIVSNSIMGSGGTAGTPRIYYAWAHAQDLTSENASGSGTGNKAWKFVTNAWVPPYPDGVGCIGPFDNAGESLALTDFRLAPQAGSITSVYIVLPVLQVVGTFGADQFTTALWKNGTLLWSRQIAAGTIVPGDLMFDITSVSNWTWRDFSSTNLTIKCTTQKSGNPTVELHIDCFGFLIWGDGNYSNATDSTTINPVPLTDNYPTNVFRYYCANPNPQLVTNYGGAFGTLWWENIGPIYPGGASTVTVTFTTLEPPGNQMATVTNYGWVTNATFVNGVLANNATDQMSVVIRPAGTIGDYVWRDNNGNGIQDDGVSSNVGIANVQVVLYPPTNVDIGAGANIPITNLTDRNGWYLFTGLPATGRYTVVVMTNTIPGSFTNTYDEDGVPNSRTIVSNMVPTSTVFTAQNHLTADFGYRLGQSLDGTVWHDFNRSATPLPPDPGEKWITGVVVRLYYSTNLTTALATNRTDANGYFIFNNLQASTYTVIVSTNEGALTNAVWHQSYDTDGTGTAHRASVSVPAGGVGHADFSYYRGLYEFGDEVFWDWNGNGTREENEEGIPNISVYAYEDANSNGVINVGVDALIGVQSTSSTGFYLFPNMPRTNIYVYVDIGDPDFPRYVFCTADPDGVYDGRNVFSITTSNDYRRDFGYQPYGYGAIGDFVWHDLNGDGVQDAVEPGISDVSVRLYVDANRDGNYVLLYSNSTDSTGWYIFTNLPDMNYRVVVNSNDENLPTDYLGHMAQPTTVTSYDITITNNSIDLTADFGFVLPGVLGDTVYWDVYENGSQDWGEDGIPGVKVDLYYDVNGNRVYDPGTDVYVNSDTTDVDGVYLFTGLWPTNYIVVVDETSAPLTNAILSADPDNDGIPCSDPAVTNCDGAYMYPLKFNEIFKGADFGYIPPGAIGDLVWIDQNNNGIQDAGERGIPHIDVFLYTNGTLVASTETDYDGIYGFYGLMDATARVVVNTNDPDFPAGLYANWDYDGVPDSRIADIVIHNGVVVSVGGAACSACNTNIDFGYRYEGNNILSGTIGLDGIPFDGNMGVTGSGVSSNEVPFAGVRVYLKLWNDDGDGVVESGEYIDLMSTATDTNGDYRFTGMPSGDGNDRYIVSMAPPFDNLRMTTTNGSLCSPPVLWITNRVDGWGNTRSAYQVMDILPVTTNIDFAFTWNQAYDFGDLPDSYSTVVQNRPSGPQNQVLRSTNLYLGASVDTEFNGQPSDDAMGDGGDEDGVTLPAFVWQNGSSGRVTVVVGKGGGWLTGYIDFNHDGSFMTTGEMVANQAVTAGTYEISFPIPSNTINAATTTVLYARFRLFPSKPFVPELSFAGMADNGEVEDYRWILGALGDTVWEDINSNETREAYEMLITGAVVYVDINSNAIREASEPYVTIGTNAWATNGFSEFYWIGGFPPGAYIIRVDTNTLLPADLYPTYDLDGGTDNVAVVTIAAGQVLTNVDFGYRTPRSTYVLLSSFEGKWVNGRAVLTWETSVELGTLGFDVFREEKGRSGCTRVNDGFLPAMIDQPQGGTYSLVDASARPGKTYVYQLNEIQCNGKIGVCGIFEVTYPRDSGAPPRMKGSGTIGAGSYIRTPRVSEFSQKRMGRKVEAAKRAEAAKRTARSSVPARRLGACPDSPAPEEWASLKVLVTHGGVYHVRSAAVAGLLGVDEGDVWARITNRALRVSNRGGQCSYIPGDDGFYFHGEAIDSLYTVTNVYWLTWDGGNMASILSGEKPVPVEPGTFADVVHVEQEFFQVPAAATDPESDYWYWNYLIVYSNVLLASNEYGVQLPAVASGAGQAMLVTHLFGGSFSGVPNEHHVRISLNGSLIGEAQWDGLRSLAVTNTFSQSLLADGSNSVTVTAVLNSGVPYSAVYVDSFDLSYRRRCEAVDDQLLVRGDGNAVMTVSGFSTPDIRVMDVSDPRNPLLLEGVAVDSDGGFYRASFNTSNAMTPYRLFALGSGKSPSSMVVDMPSDLRAETNAADYVVITVPELAASAETLADYRRGKGMSAQVVLLDDIYDEFGDGLAEPPSIKRFVSHAGCWSVPPRYILLAGEGTYDYKNRRGAGDNMVPTVLVPTPGGLHASDGWYTDLDGDFAPDIAIGRLPALTADELDALIAKIVDYEMGEGGRWKQDVLLAADNPDDGGDFSGSSDIVESLTPPDYTVQRVDLSQHKTPEAQALLLNAINAGSVFVNYFGHGGLDVMAAEKLFQVSDVGRLTNGAKRPVVVSLSCAIGQFALPGFDCLSEVLLLSTGGAVAVWAPTGESYNRGAEALADVFYRRVFRDGEGILGDAIKNSLKEYDFPGRVYMRKIYNLLGDPAMRLEGSAFLRADATLQSWGRKHFTAAQLTNETYSGFNADPDGDGVPNLMEYAMGWNPNVVDGDPRVTVLGPWQISPNSSGEIVVLFQRRKGVGDVEIRVQSSPDVKGGWVVADSHIKSTTVTDDGNGLTESVRVTLSVPLDDEVGRGYVRLRVRQRR